jgi:DNA-binding transcriptional ArsR family regulator
VPRAAIRAAARSGFLASFQTGYKTQLGPIRFNQYNDAWMTGLNCIAALKALGEETRLRILRLLFKEQLSVNGISERLRVSQYNVSKHLRIMREAGLLETEKRGKQRLYSVTTKLKSQVTANNNVLDLGCCTFRLDKLAK